MRLINADNLKPDVKTFTSLYSEELTAFYSQEAIDKAIIIDTAPVKRGKWITHKENEPLREFVCSECKGLVELSHYAYKCYYNYCPNCGVKMI